MTAKMLIFMVQMAYYKVLLTWSVGVLAIFHNQPKLELIVVMVILPTIFNTLIFWIQDLFLKGDKHLDERKLEQEAIKRAERAKRRELNYNFGKGNEKVAAAQD